MWRKTETNDVKIQKPINTPGINNNRRTKRTKRKEKKKC